MKCRICGKETETKIKSYNLAICKDCFLKRLWGRVGETIRKHSMFERKEKVYIVKEHNNALALENILMDMGYEVEVVEEADDAQGGVLAIGNLLEDEVAHSIWRILNWDITDEMAPVYQQGNIKIVKPLCLILEEELFHYKKIKGIEEKEREGNFVKDKIKEKRLLSAGFWLSFYKSLVKEKEKLNV